MKKRILALILSAVMIFSMGAAAAFACDDEPAEKKCCEHKCFDWNEWDCKHCACDWPEFVWPDWEWPDWDCPDWEWPDWEWPDWDCPDWEWPDWEWPDWDCPDCPDWPDWPEWGPTDPTDPAGTFEVVAEDHVYDMQQHGGEVVNATMPTSRVFYVGTDGTDYAFTDVAPTEVGTYVAYAYGYKTMKWAKYQITPVTVKFTLTDQEIWSGETIDDVWYTNYFAEGFMSDITDFDPTSLKDREFTETEVKIVVVDKDGKVLTDYSKPGTYTLRVIPKFKDGMYNRNYQILESKIFDGKLIVKDRDTENTGDSSHVYA